MSEEREPTITVTCRTPGCANDGIPIELPNDGVEVVCGGGCNMVLAEQADWYEPPEPEPGADPVIDVAERIASMDEDQRAALIALLAGGNEK